MRLIWTLKRRLCSGGGSRGRASATKGSAARGHSTGSAAAREGGEGSAADAGSIASLPKLREAPAVERSELFRRKVDACCVVFDFSSDSCQHEKDAKRQTLLEMVEYVNNTRFCFNEALMRSFVNMVSLNMFRPLHTRCKDGNNSPGLDVEEDVEEPRLERAWPHLHIVYELLLRFIVSNDVDAKVAKRFVDQRFILKLFDLFDSEDPRERDYLKTVLHRIYGKFIDHRSFIRRAIQNVFFKATYEPESHNGVGELLEIVCSFISGFALPLKEEHKDFLMKALIPLHKVKPLGLFNQQLTQCMTQYLEKDPRLAYDIITGILRCWPVSATAKQVMFLNELEKTLEFTQPYDFSRLQVQLFHRLALCMSCPHFQVAERALSYWNNEYIVELINQNRHVLFPMIIKALYKNSRQHWNGVVYGLSLNVLKLMMEADPPLFDQCTAQHQLDEEEEERRDHARKQKWKTLQDLYNAKAGNKQP